MSDPLGAGDDRLHPGRTEDRSWTETAWFAAAVPERGLAVWTYPLFRPELGVMSCGIYVWEPGAEELWQLPYYRTWWHLPIPDDLDLTGFRLSNGLGYECLEPLIAYRVTYADEGELELDLTFRGLHPPHGVGVVAGGHGHLDQLGTVRGEIVLGGERIEVDCFEMRDRTWSARRESRKRTFVSYSYGAGEGGGFHLSTRLDPKLGENRILTGFRLLDGSVRPFAEGSCEVERDTEGRPLRVRLAAKDADGGEFSAAGEVVSRLSMPSTPWFVWACVVRWRLEDGSEVFGEHQDTWSPAALRAARPTGRASATKMPHSSGTCAPS